MCEPIDHLMGDREVYALKDCHMHVSNQPVASQLGHLIDSIDLMESYRIWGAKVRETIYRRYTFTRSMIHVEFDLSIGTL